MASDSFGMQVVGLAGNPLMAEATVNAVTNSEITTDRFMRVIKTG